MSDYNNERYPNSNYTYFLVDVEDISLKLTKITPKYLVLCT